MGLGGFDTKHPLSLHMLGMHGTAERELRGRRLRLVDRDRRAFRRSRRGRPEKVRAEGEPHPALRHRPVRDPQGQEGGLASRRAAAATRSTRSSRTGGARPSAPTSARGTTRSRSSKSTYALNYDRDSPLIQPQYVIETMNQITQGEAIISTGVGQHQMWAAQYLRLPRTAALDDVGQHGHDGLRPARRDRRAVREARASS